MSPGGGRFRGECLDAEPALFMIVGVVIAPTLHHSNTAFFSGMLALIFSLCVLLPAFAEDPITVQIGTSEDEAPFRDSDLAGGGMTTVIITEAFKRLENYELDIDSYSTWPEVEEETLKNDSLGAFPYYYSKERGKKFEFSEPLAKSLVVWITRADTDLTDTTDEDLKGLKVAKPLGYFVHDVQPYVDKGILEMVRPKTMQDAFYMLADGEVDLVSVDLHEGSAAIKACRGLETDEFVYLDHKNHEAALNTLHLMISRAHPEANQFRYQFDQVIKEMRANGVLEDLQKKALEDFQNNYMEGEMVPRKR